MSRGVIVAIVTVVVVAAVCWFGGAAIWNAVLVMHGRR
jgi:Flp pilus assembly pilin Flp